MPPQARRLVDIGVGICCCHSGCVGMTGTILTGSGDGRCNSSGIARLGDIVMGACGHIGILVTSSSTARCNGLGMVRLGDVFTGCFSGTIVTGSGNTTTGG